MFRCATSLQTQDNLLTVTYYRFRKQVISSQHTISHNIIHIMRDKWRYGEGILPQRNTKAQQEKLNPVVLAQIYMASVSEDAPLAATSLFGYFYPLYASPYIVLHGVCLMIYVSQCLVVSKCNSGYYRILF